MPLYVLIIVNILINKTISSIQYQYSRKQSNTNTIEAVQYQYNERSSVDRLSGKKVHK